MKKHQRLAEITRLIQEQGTVRVSEIMEYLQVTDMTVRRDLAELEREGVLTKIHGGARSNKVFRYKEYSHKEKHIKDAAEKEVIAEKALSLIGEGDVLFLGPGTTVECLAKKITHSSLTVVTNCLPIFQLLANRQNEQFRLFLLGGEMRTTTEAFVGELANIQLKNMRFSKAFFSANGVRNEFIMTSTQEEGYTQALALERSVETYLLLNSSKIGRDDFTVFASLDSVTALITEKEAEDLIDIDTQIVEII